MYLDGFLLPLPKHNTEAYRAIATKAGQLWMEHGALAYRETILDDTDTPMGGCETFPNALKLKEGEVVVLAYILYKSKEDRDIINKKVFEDPRMNEMPGEMPFDMARMAYGGFIPLVEFGNV